MTAWSLSLRQFFWAPAEADTSLDRPFITTRRAADGRTQSRPPTALETAEGDLVDTLRTRMALIAGTEALSAARESTLREFEVLIILN
jgi:hypothetical protein